jgi:CHAT domain-containing protein
MLGSAEALTSLAAQTGVAGALERFPDIQRLVIVPHDAIANVPFAALPIRDEPLCARGIAITQLDRLERLRRRRWFQRSGRTISVGLSSYEGSGYCDLPAAEREATSVAALAGADLWTGPDATCDQVRNALRTAQRVHVAAHGIAGTSDPSQAGIVLRDGDGHGLLTMHQLRRERFRRLALVSLATCRSAESAFMPGGERICLPTALLDAGARGVIAALWRVDDEPSVEVMTTLYRRLQVEPPSLALVRTQAELHRRPADQWAGLAFYGND